MSEHPELPPKHKFYVSKERISRIGAFGKEVPPSYSLTDNSPYLNIVAPAGLLGLLLGEYQVANRQRIRFDPENRYSNSVRDVADLTDEILLANMKVAAEDFWATYISDTEYEARTAEARRNFLGFK